MKAGDVEMMTVGELRKAIADLHDEVWVIVSGFGPAVGTLKEPFAHEPFVVIVGTKILP